MMINLPDELPGTSAVSLFLYIYIYPNYFFFLNYLTLKHDDSDFHAVTITFVLF